MRSEAFADDLRSTFQDVRGAFTELLSSVSADPRYPQAIARRLGIDKNLAWKVAKIANTTEPHEAVPSIPGAGGVEIVLKAFAKEGAPAQVIDATREAMVRFDNMVSSHVGDRATLRLVLSSMAAESVPQECVESTRKLAFQGNSGVWGIQGRVRLASFFIAPNADDRTLIDTVSMGGFIDVRRLRPKASVPLFMRFAYNDDGSLRDGPRPQPIDADCPPEDDLMLWREFCSSRLPEFLRANVNSCVRYDLAPGPVGNSGLNTWIYGEFTPRFASIYRDEVNAVGEHAVPVHMPLEYLVCDLQVHREFEFALRPRVAIYSQLASGPMPIGESDHDRLPLTEPVQDIGRCPPIVSTPLVPRYSEMCARLHARLGWDPRDFCGFRFVMRYPPMPANFVFQHDLATPK